MWEADKFIKHIDPDVQGYYKLDYPIMNLQQIGSYSKTHRMVPAHYKERAKEIIRRELLLNIEERVKKELKLDSLEGMVFSPVTITEEPDPEGFMPHQGEELEVVLKGKVSVYKMVVTQVIPIAVSKPVW